MPQRELTKLLCSRAAVPNQTRTRNRARTRSSSATTKATATTTVLITAETTIPPQKHGHNGQHSVGSGSSRSGVEWRQGLAYQLTNAMRNCKCKIPARLLAKDMARGWGESQVGGGLDSTVRLSRTETHTNSQHTRGQKDKKSEHSLH